MAVTAVADDGTPWTIRAGTFSSKVAAQQHASGLAREAKRAGLPTPRVLLAKSDEKPQKWIVEIGSFDQREQGEAARKKFATRDTIVVRTCAPASSKRS